MSVLPCAPRQVIEIVVGAADGQPLQDVAVVLLDGTKITRALTSSAGVARFEGLAARDHKVTLTEYDRRTWSVTGNHPIHESRSAVTAAVTWEDPPEPAEAQASTHTVAAGEGLRSIAAEYGHLPETVAGANAKLLEQHPVLQTSDVVKIPPLEAGQETVAAGRIYYVKVAGTRLPFRVRLLEQTGEPIAAAAVLLTIDCDDDVEREAVPARTDDDGFIEVWLPNETVQVTIDLGPVEESRTWIVPLHDYVPASDKAGLLARLDALGYYAGGPDDETDELLAEALAAFQEDSGLEVTGEADSGTLAFLEAVYLS